MEKYEAVKEKLCKEFDAIGRKIESGADINDTDLNRLDRITHTLKCLETYKAMEDAEERHDMSGRMGHSYARGNDDMGRSYADGYNQGYHDGQQSGHYPMMPGYDYRYRNGGNW